MGRAFEYRKAAKEKRWDRMSKLFPKLAKAITVAARDGGADPEVNAKLRTAIQNAKAENMPKDNIENAIRRAATKGSDEITEATYEGKGPHGVLVFAECATDNPNRTVANIKSHFSKAGGGVVPSGSLEFMFARKAVFEFEKEENMDMEELELSLIDSGLEEIGEDHGMVYLHADYTNYGEISKALDSLKIYVKKASLRRVPLKTVTFSDEQLQDIERMIDKMEDDDDVLAVYTNMG